MGLNQWMVMEALPTETEFLLKRTEVEMREAIGKDPEKVLAFAAMVIRQNTERGRLLERAMRRIAELEMREAIGQKADLRPWVKVARQIRPPWWVRAMWAVTGVRVFGPR